MVVDLRIGRGDENAGIAVDHRRHAGARAELVEDLGEEVGVTAVDVVHAAEVEPHPPGGDGLDHLRAR